MCVCGNESGSARLFNGFLTVQSSNIFIVINLGSLCTSQADLQALLTQKPTSFRLYDGFEPSGRMHIAQGVFKAVNVNKCTAAGGTFVFWVRQFGRGCYSRLFLFMDFIDKFTDERRMN